MTSAWAINGGAHAKIVVPPPISKRDVKRSLEVVQGIAQLRMQCYSQSDLDKGMHILPAGVTHKAMPVKENR